MSRLFPPVMPSKQTTSLAGAPIKIYFEPSRFNGWSSIEHAQINLYEVDTNTSLLNGTGALVHKRDSENNLLYIQSDGTLGTAVTAQPYYITSSTLQLLFFDKSEFKTDGERKYIEIPAAYCPLGKLLKTQVRLATVAVPDTPTPAWITNELAHGRLSEWSSPSVFRVIQKPELTWDNSASSFANPFPTFYCSASSQETIIRMVAVLNDEVVERKMTAWALTDSFEFKRALKDGSNLLTFEIETEGGHKETESFTVLYATNGREPSYYVQEYRTGHGGIDLTLVDEERSNYFAYPAPMTPPNTKYTSVTGTYEFVRGETCFCFTNNRQDTINVSYRYTIHYDSVAPSEARVFLKYDYVDGTSDTHDLGLIQSSVQRTCESMPPSDGYKALRYSYLYMEFIDNSVAIFADSVRISRAKTVPVNHYLVRRASAKEGYQNWETILEFDADANSTGKWTYLDNTAQSGVVYQYVVVGRDDDGSLSKPGKKVFAMSDAEGVWLSTENHKALSFIFDTSITGLRIAKREAVVETLGSQYPFVSTSGKMEYYTFSLSGTLFHEIDALDELRSGMYYRSEVPGLDEQIVEQDIISRSRLSYEKNYIHEREVREALLKELGSIKPVLFKSDGEPNMIVRLTNISVNPRRELGNVIYNFSAQVSEVAACTMENVHKYNLQNERVIEID